MSNCSRYVSNVCGQTELILKSISLYRRGNTLEKRIYARVLVADSYRGSLRFRELRILQNVEGPIKVLRVRNGRAHLHNIESLIQKWIGWIRKTTPGKSTVKSPALSRIRAEQSESGA